MSTYSGDTTKVAPYTLKVTAQYTGAYTNIAEQAFTVIIVDTCTTATLSIDPSILSTLTITYNISYTTHIEILDVSLVSSTGSSNCPSYVFSFTDQSNAAIDGTVFTYDEPNLEFETYSANLAKAGQFPLRLKVRYDGDPTHYTNFGQLDFDVTLVDTCIAATLTVNSAILTSTSITYSIYNSADTQTLSTSNVDSTETTATCPTILLDVLNNDGIAIDTSVFTYTSGTSTFAIQSSDTTKLGIYNLKVTAKYTGASYTNISELAFTVTIDDPCVNEILSIDPTILTSLTINYNIGYPADV